MFKSIKALDPSTKQVLVAVGVQISILAVCAVAVVKLDKTLKTN